MTPRVKLLDAGDTALLKACAEMEQRCFSDPWSEQSFLETARSASAHVLAALDETGTLLGYLVYSHVLDEAEIAIVAAAPEHRRQGIADVMLTRFTELLPETTVYLEVRASNIPAQRLYQKHGFKMSGVRKHYYRNPTEDAILMSRRPFMKGVCPHADFRN